MTALLAGIALATPWRPAGEPTDLGIDTTDVAHAAIGEWSGGRRIITGNDDGITFRNADGGGAFQVPLPTRGLALVDLDRNGTSELVSCGPTGLHVLRKKSAGELDDVVLNTEACDELAIGLHAQVPVLLLRKGTEVAILAPGERGLERKHVQALDGATHISMRGAVKAGLTDQLVLEAGNQVQNIAIPADTVDIASDGVGWALAVGGEDPHLVRADGTKIPLPHTPVAVSQAFLGRPELLVTLDGPAFLAGSHPPTLYAVPENSRPLASGDLNGDGCGDLLFVGPSTQVQLGDCSVFTLAAKPAQVPSTPLVGDLDFGPAWAILQIQVGHEADLRLVDKVANATEFTLQAGPPGLRIDGDKLTYTPRRTDVGVWRAPIVVGDRHTGVIVKVIGAVPEAELPEVTEIDHRFRNNVPRTHRGSSKSPFAFRECFVGLGAAAGASKNEQTSWSSVGLPDTLWSGSPALMMSCNGGAEMFRWVFGVDTAPTFFYVAPSGRMNHILAGTFGVQFHTPAFRAGPFVSAGVLVFGAGVRAQITPFTTKKGQRHGPEIRATTFPVVLSGQVMLAYTLGFGRF